MKNSRTPESVSAPGLTMNKYADRTLSLLRLLLVMLAGFYMLWFKDGYYFYLITVFLLALFIFMSAPFRDLLGGYPLLPVILDEVIILIFCYITGGLDSPFIFLFLLPVLVNTINTSYLFLFLTILSTSTCLFILGLFQQAAWAEILHPVAVIIIVALFFKILLDKDFYILSRYATRDGLTGLYSHRYFYEQLRMLLSSNDSAVVSLIMIDLNDFKRLNDEKGHLEGDRVLREVAHTIKASVRDNDLVARYGGDEFAVILPGASRDICNFKVEAIRTGIKNLGYFSDVAVGCAHYPEDAQTVAGLVEVADQRMYLLKRRQRNEGFFLSWRD